MSHATLEPVQQGEMPPLSQDFLLQKIPGWTLAHWCVLVFAASFLILLFLPEARLDDSEVPNGAETVRVARSLATRGAFANPFATLPTGTTAHLAPVYPFLYSLVIRGFGTGSTALRVAWALNLACLALQLALLPLLSYRLNLGVLPGILAAGLGTISLHAPVDTRWECFLSGTLLLAAYLLTDWAFRSRSVPSALISGAIWGITLLTNPVTVLLLPVLPLCFVLSQPRQQRPARFRLAAVVCAFAMLVTSPWIIRNYMRFDTFIFIRDNLGLELYTGNNDCASPDLRANIQSGCHARTHPNPTAAIAAQLAAAGEIGFYHQKLRESLHWIATHPARFLYLTAQRFALFWFPHADRRWESILVAIITLLSLPGLWLMARKNFQPACFIASTWLFFPLIYYCIPFEPRYRYPVYWTSLLPAGYLLVQIFHGGRSPHPVDTGASSLS